MVSEQRRCGVASAGKPGRRVRARGAAAGARAAAAGAQGAVLRRCAASDGAERERRGGRGAAHGRRGLGLRAVVCGV